MNTKCLSEREKPMQHLCSIFHITESLYFLHSLWSQRRNIQQQLKPWLAILQSRRSNGVATILRSLRTFSHTSVNIFRCSTALAIPTRASLSIKSPPEMQTEEKRERERTLIWLCNTVQFAIGQWNSISFSSLWSISIWRVSTHIVFS